MAKLLEIADKYGTDKGTPHGFAPFYDKYLAKTVKGTKKVVEIGVDSAKSLKMWKEYFPNAEIIGIDIENKVQYNEERIKTVVLDQGNGNQLDSFVDGDDADLIVDDGSHIMEHQQVSLGHLFPKLKSGGIYILEDLHTSYYQGYLVTDTNKTYEFIKTLETTGKSEFIYLTPEQNIYIEDNVKKVVVLDADIDHMTCLIWKK
jgi:trans-aconitate methyltransferase